MSNTTTEIDLKKSTLLEVQRQAALSNIPMRQLLSERVAEFLESSESERVERLKPKRK